MKSERYQKELPVKLSEEEVTDRARSCSRIVNEIVAHKAKAAAEKKELTAKEKALDEEVKRLAGIVRAKSEPRQVEVYDRANIPSCTIDTIRADTMEIVDSRAMTEGELLSARQGALFAEEAPPPRKGSKEKPS